VVAPFSFAHFGRSGPIFREGDSITLPYSTRNPIEYAVPELFYHDGGLLDVPNQRSEGLSSSACITKMFNIWSTDWIQRSVYEGDIYSSACPSHFADFVSAHSSFGFLRLLDLSPGEVHSLHVMPLITRRLIAIKEEINMVQDSPYSLYVLLTMCLDDLLTRTYQRWVICSTHTCQLIPHQSIAPPNLLG
jgi:DNA helicase INO80